MDRQSLTFILVFLVLAVVVAGSVFFIVRSQNSAGGSAAPSGTVSGSTQGSTNLTESAFYMESMKNASSGASIAP